MGRAAARALKEYPDLECAGIFSRRGAAVCCEGADVYPLSEIKNFKSCIDVLLLTMSSSDLRAFSPYLSQHFNIVEGFDMHENVREHFLSVDRSSKRNKKTALICAGWDPGLFSLIRLIDSAFNPFGRCFTFWGEGVSQGHSSVIRSVNGVQDAIEYTIPDENAVNAVKKGNFAGIDKFNMHKRRCFVCLKEGADRESIAEKIKNTEIYFKGYDTEVNFTSCEEIERRKQHMAHKGAVISNYPNAADGALMEFYLNMESNPDFTARILLSLARAVHMMKKSGDFGAKTIFDIKPKWLIMGEDTLKFL